MHLVCIWMAPFLLVTLTYDALSCTRLLYIHGPIPNVRNHHADKAVHAKGRPIWMSRRVFGNIFASPLLLHSAGFSKLHYDGACSTALLAWILSKLARLGSGTSARARYATVDSSPDVCDFMRFLLFYVHQARLRDVCALRSRFPAPRLVITALNEPSVVVATLLSAATGFYFILELKFMLLIQVKNNGDLDAWFTM